MSFSILVALLWFPAAAGAEPAEQERSSAAQDPVQQVIGLSTEGRKLTAYRFGEGPKTGIVYAGIHGGYEWNTIQLARLLVDHFRSHPRELPEGWRLYIIPAVNPDGLYRVTKGVKLEEFDFSSANIAPGRFNGRGVDLNRNFGGGWEPTAYWGGRIVDPGQKPFSEPETRALRDFVFEKQPQFIVSYHSAANGIYYGGKRDGWEPARRLAKAYARESGYPVPEGEDSSLVSYEITGAATNYFYTRRIPSITVELAGRGGPEFSRNLAGLRALFSAAP